MRCSSWHFSQMTLKLSCESLDPSPKFNYALRILYQVHEKGGLAKGWKILTGNISRRKLIVDNNLAYSHRKSMRSNGKKGKIREEWNTRHTNDGSRNIPAQLIICKICFIEDFFSSIIIFCSSLWHHHRQLVSTSSAMVKHTSMFSFSI